jgi:hypothetical protein
VWRGALHAWSAGSVYSTCDLGISFTKLLLGFRVEDLG